jgi:hypothetical protein
LTISCLLTISSPSLLTLTISPPPHHFTSPSHLTISPHHLTSPSFSPHHLTSPSHLTISPHHLTSPSHLTISPHHAISPHHLTSPSHLTISPHHLTSPSHLTSSSHLPISPHHPTSPSPVPRATAASRAIMSTPRRHQPCQPRRSLRYGCACNTLRQVLAFFLTFQRHARLLPAAHKVKEHVAPFILAPFHLTHSHTAHTVFVVHRRARRRLPPSGVACAARGAGVEVR